VPSTTFSKGDRVLGEGFSWECMLENRICSALITIQNAFDQVFEPSPLKISNVANYESVSLERTNHFYIGRF
jgi:hypothetical protein